MMGTGRSGRTTGARGERRRLRARAAGVCCARSERIAAVQQVSDFKDFTLITPEARLTIAGHGGRAKCLQRLIRLGVPVPRTVALSFDAVHRIAQGHAPDTGRLMAAFGRTPLV